MTFRTKTSLAALAVVAVMLSGCGSDKNANAGPRLIKDTAVQIFKGRAKGAGPAPAITRAELAAFKTPMIQADIAAMGLTTYLVPYVESGGVETWSTADDKTVSFRQGIMIATRGFGPDIMQSTAPSVAQIASASGSYDRVYYYLDGADQTQRYEFRCSLANAGSEAVVVVNQQHMTRHVIETCTGKQGDFVNDYWFENGSFLRKSNQLLIPDWGHFTFQRVIDNG